MLFVNNESGTKHCPMPVKGKQNRNNTHKNMLFKSEKMVNYLKKSKSIVGEYNSKYVQYIDLLNYFS